MVAGLRDGGDTVPDVPNLTTSLNRLPYLLQQRPEDSCNKEHVMAVMLVDGENPFPDVLDSLASRASFNKVPNFLEYGGRATPPRTAWWW